MFSLALLGLVLLLTTLWAGRYSLSKRHQWRLAAKLPGPKGLPLLGNCLSFIGGPAKTFQTFLDLYVAYGNVARIWLGPKLYVGLSDPADLKVVFRNPKSQDRDHVINSANRSLIGDGLLTNSGPAWRRNRKLITPAFNGKVSESFVATFAEKAEVLAERIDELADGRTTDIHHQICLCFLDSICQIATGTNMDVQRKGRSDFGEAVSEAMDLMYNRVIYPWLMLDWLYPWTSDGKKAKGVIQRLHAFSEGVIAAKLASYSTRDVDKDSVCDGGDKRAASFLDLLIEESGREGQLLTAAEIRDEVTSMAIGATDTTSSTMAHALVFLGMHPDYQEKIHEELESIFQGDTRSETPEDLNRMKVLEYAIKETLRIVPPVMVLAREVAQDLEISNGYILPAGCSVVGVNFVLHHNPAFFPDPESFLPERWTPENSVGRDPYPFLAFGDGPHRCIGQKYAMLALKTTLSCLLRRYRFTCDCYSMEDRVKLEVRMTVKSAVGYRLQIHRRSQV